MTSTPDTIYALASAPGPAGVAVVRISGSHTAACLEALCGVLPRPRVATLVSFSHGVEIDRGLALWFPGPKSFTGEDMAELQCHGGRAVLQALYHALAAQGCRLAQPGEFTRRAVLNGKLDLTSAEGVADIVAAETEAQRQQALRQLGGGLQQLVQGWAVELTRLEAHLAAAIDFADDDLPADLLPGIRSGLAALQEKLAAKLGEAAQGERLREGLYVAILGAPNAGKSSLLNALAQRDVAIVTEIAGTTRDVLEVPLAVGGYPLTLADTAGLRDAADRVEQEGIRRALQRAEAADLRLLVVDATTAAHEVLQHYRTGDIVVLNKSDAVAMMPAIPMPALALSTRTGEGMPELLQALGERAEALAGLTASPALTRARHRECVKLCSDHLARALAARQVDQMAEDVRLAARALGQLTGQTGVEDLLDIIFRDFCLGK